MKGRWGIRLGAIGFLSILMVAGFFGDKLLDMASDVIKPDFTVTPSGVTHQNGEYIVTFITAGKTLILRLDEDSFFELREKLNEWGKGKADARNTG